MSNNHFETVLGRRLKINKIITSREFIGFGSCPAWVIRNLYNYGNVDLAPTLLARLNMPDLIMALTLNNMPTEYEVVEHNYYWRVYDWLSNKEDWELHNAYELKLVKKVI